MSLQFVIGVDRTPEHRLSKHVLMSANGGGGGGGRGGPCSTWWVGPTEVDPGQRQREHWQIDKRHGQRIPHTQYSLCVSLCVCVANEACVGNNERRRNWERNSHPVMKHVAKDSSARAGNWIDTFGYGLEVVQRQGQAGWWRVDEAAGGGGGFLVVVASQPSQPMIALVSDELGMPQN